MYPAQILKVAGELHLVSGALENSEYNHHLALPVWIHLSKPLLLYSPIVHSISKISTVMQFLNLIHSHLLPSCKINLFFLFLEIDKTVLLLLYCLSF